MEIKYFNLSYIGRRSYNQDRSVATNIDEKTVFLAVADGMGGTKGGEIAAEAVLSSTIEIIRKRISTLTGPGELKDILREVFATAQEVIKQRIEQEPTLNGMGTTLTCVLIHDGKYVWGNLGDSRTYRFGENFIEQITVDHTYIQDYISKHGQSALPANVLKKFSNYLLKAIDGGNDQPDIFPVSKDYEILEDKTGFLLCSDGLITDKISGDIDLFKNIILGNKTLEKAAKNLISLAFHSGSTDNISVVLAEVGKIKRKRLKIPKYKFPPKDEKKKPAPTKKNNKLIAAVSSMIVALVILLFFQITNWEFSIPFWGNEKTVVSDTLKSNEKIPKKNDKKTSEETKRKSRKDTRKRMRVESKNKAISSKKSSKHNPSVTQQQEQQQNKASKPNTIAPKVVSAPTTIITTDTGKTISDVSTDSLQLNKNKNTESNSSDTSRASKGEVKDSNITPTIAITENSDADLSKSSLALPDSGNSVVNDTTKTN